MDPAIANMLLASLQLMLLGLGSWTLITTIQTKERVIKLEAKVFDSMNNQVQDHAQRIHDLELALNVRRQ